MLRGMYCLYICAKESASLSVGNIGILNRFDGMAGLQKSQIESKISHWRLGSQNNSWSAWRHVISAAVTSALRCASNFPIKIMERSHQSHEPQAVTLELHCPLRPY